MHMMYPHHMDHHGHASIKRYKGSVGMWELLLLLFMSVNLIYAHLSAPSRPGKGIAGKGRLNLQPSTDEAIHRLDRLCPA